VDLSRYASLLIDRYCNPALKHRTWQIAMDGSQKLPQRMLDSVRWHLAHQHDFTLLALGVAGWMRYVGGVDDAGQAIEICDPLLPVIQQAVAASADGEARVKALLGIEAIFGGVAAGAPFRLGGDPRLSGAAAAGAKATVAAWAAAQ
jgi:fructuronate reductase